MSPASPHIGTLTEKSLHAALKRWYAEPSDLLETRVEGYVVDIVRGDLLIEIQTRNFAALKPKLTRLVPGHPLRLVHPIAREKWIRRVGADGETVIGRRRSSKHGALEHLFDELVSFPQLAAHPNFTLEILLIEEEEVRQPQAAGARVSWRRRGWQIGDRQLLGVVERRVLAGPDDFRAPLPASLPERFTNRELAEALVQPLPLAQKMTYCLRGMGALELAGQEGRQLVYTLKAQ